MFPADIAALPDLQAQDTLNSAAFHDTVAAWDKEFGYFVDSINGTLRYGGTGNDSLSGSKNRDAIIGLQNDDVITGNNGDDLLDGGSGNDSL
jgi:Ca2+-binding RTX toxin-like protein